MPRPLIVLFCLVPVWWGWLLTVTRPHLIYDAVGYVELGRVVANKGLLAYFQSGLQREPLFPVLVALAMKVEGLVHIPFPFIVKAMLMICLASTVWGVYRLARLLSAGRTAAGLAALYTAVSPALLHSTLWLWSEASALPWMIWGTVFLIWTWRAAGEGGGAGWPALLAVTTGVLFLGLTMVKAAATVVFPLLIIPFLIAATVRLVRGERSRAWAFTAAALLAAGSYMAAMEWYKWNNMTANGSYAVTNRVESALYGNTVRRLAPLTARQVAQAVLAVPRLGFCERYYGRECVYWTFVKSDAVSLRAKEILTTRGLSPAAQHQWFLQESVRLIRAHPFQEIGFCVLEAAKMLFWENRLYFVAYPSWLAAFYGSPWFVFLLCFGWAIVGLAALARALWRGAHGNVAHGFAALSVLTFAGAYSIFFIDIRYGLPVAPILIAMTAAMFSRKPKPIPSEVQDGSEGPREGSC